MVHRALGLLVVLAFCSFEIRAGDGLVQLTTADASCPDASGNRFVDCQNGTMTDNESGLTWLQDASCLNTGLAWPDAMLTTAGLSSGHCGLTDNSGPGDWRLPTKEEWEAMVADPALECSPAITNDAGTDCWVSGEPGSSFIGVGTGFHWSATTVTNNAAFAWFVNLFNGFIGDGEAKTSENIVWPVRGGQ